MNDEPKSIQQRIDSLLAELETNGRLSADFAADLPAVIAAIPDGEHFDLILSTFRGFRAMWHKHPEIERLFAYLCTLFERDGTRRALSENIEVGWLERTMELPGGPDEKKG